MWKVHFMHLWSQIETNSISVGDDEWKVYPLVINVNFVIMTVSKSVLGKRWWRVLLIEKFTFGSTECPSRPSMDFLSIHNATTRDSNLQPSVRGGMLNLRTTEPVSNDVNI